MEGQLPDFLLLKYVLNPENDGLKDMAVPPPGESLAATQQPIGTADDDVPF